MDLPLFESATTSGTAVRELVEAWTATSREDLEAALAIASEMAPSVGPDAEALQSLPADVFDRLSRQPSVVFWSTVTLRSALGVPSTSVDGRVIAPDPGHVSVILDQTDELTRDALRVHRPDPWLRLPFDDGILYEEGPVVQEGAAALEEALAIVRRWDPALEAELRTTCSEVQFIQDAAAPDRIVSFSDDVVPGALYVSVRRGEDLLPPELLADSLVHEYRHQKLYLLQRTVPLLEQDSPPVVSPWRSDPRPPSGLLHAVFVFSCLLDFWRHLDRDPACYPSANREAETIEGRLHQAFPVLWGTPLTSEGAELVGILAERVGAPRGPSLSARALP